jgi:hypothetical protein
MTSLLEAFMIEGKETCKKYGLKDITVHQAMPAVLISVGLIVFMALEISSVLA